MSPGSVVDQQPGGGQAVVVQPVPRPPGCPPGLELLTMVDHILIQQQIEVLEALTGFETNNKYVIRNSLGHQMYFAVEENDCCTRSCCGPNRPFEMRILDNYGQQIARIHRPCGCNAYGIPCIPHEIMVTAPPGTIIGSVKQNCACCTPDYNIMNEAGQVVFTVVGPCEICMCGVVSLPVLSADRSTQVGLIHKKWGGVLKEWFTKADTFGVSFPVDLDVKVKATLLAATFLIVSLNQCPLHLLTIYFLKDYVYFENKN